LQLSANGGQVIAEPMDVMSAGRMAIFADPQGAAFMIFKGSSDMPPGHDQAKLGHIGWRELLASDVSTAWDFYAQMFGWTKGDAHDQHKCAQTEEFQASAGSHKCPPRSA